MRNKPEPTACGGIPKEQLLPERKPVMDSLPKLKVVWEVLWQWVGKGMQLVTVIGVLALNVGQGNYAMLALVGAVGAFACLLAVWDFKHLYGKCQDVSLTKAPSWQEMRRDIKEIKDAVKEVKTR